MIDRHDAPENLIAVKPIYAIGNIRLCSGCCYYRNFGPVACIHRMPYPGVLARRCSKLLREDKEYVIFVKGWIYKHEGD